jgi:hypothetical protein
VDGGDTSNIVSGQVCQECQVPDRLILSNCIHLQSGVLVFQMNGYGGPTSLLQGNSFDCALFDFENAEQLFAQCDSPCAKRNPVHRDISHDELLNVRDLPATPTDRDIRQGVLLALYEYHARFFERFLKFDVTPEHLAVSLGLELADIHRVVGPMDEAGEVRTLQDTQDISPRFVTITQKGIEAMNDEPLFESKGVRVTDNSIKIEGSNNQVAREQSRNDQRIVTIGGDGLQQAMEQLRAVQAQLGQIDLSPETRSEVSESFEMVFEEAARPEPRAARLKAGLSALHRLLESNVGTFAAAALVLQIHATVVGMG